MLTEVAFVRSSRTVGASGLSVEEENLESSITTEPYSKSNEPSPDQIDLNVASAWMIQHEGPVLILSVYSS